MNKKTYFAFLSLPLLLASCGGNNNISSGESIHSEASQTSEPSLVPSSESEIIPEWDDDIKEALMEAVGTDDVPCFEAEYYDYEIKEETGDSGYVQTFLQIDCYPADWAQAKRIYSASCLEDGYEIYEEYEDPLAYKDVSVTDTLYLQFYVTKETYTFTILAYRVTERLAEWPSDEAYMVCGGDLPMIEATSYGASIDVSSIGTPAIYGVAYGVDEDDVIAYAKMLENIGWKVEEDSQYYMFTANNLETGVRILFYNYDDYMQFIAYNADLWKYGNFIVNVENGFTLPTPMFDSIEAYYMDVKLEDGSTVFTLYLEDVSETMYATYLNQLYAGGWTDDPEESEYAGQYSHYLTKKIGTKTHKIACLYSEKYSMIALPIYC
ncbi:MAG: hypothetical protein MJ239_03500 [Bacilli bacterium]|nr:hypothetical protein [Bacilli bacterium]